MVIKKLFETTPKSLKLFGIGELTPFFITPKNPLKLGTLTPVSSITRKFKELER